MVEKVTYTIQSSKINVQTVLEQMEYNPAVKVNSREGGFIVRNRRYIARLIVHPAYFLLHIYRYSENIIPKRVFPDDALAIYKHLLESSQEEVRHFNLNFNELHFIEEKRSNIIQEVNDAKENKSQGKRKIIQRKSRKGKKTRKKAS